MNVSSFTEIYEEKKKFGVEKLASQPATSAHRPLAPQTPHTHIPLQLTEQTVEEKQANNCITNVINLTTEAL